MLHNVYEELNEEQLQQIKNDKLTFAVFSLLDKYRFAVLVKVKGINSRNYKQFQMYIEDYYKTLLEKKILSKVKLNEVVYWAIDYKMYINNDCKHLKIKSC